MTLFLIRDSMGHEKQLWSKVEVDDVVSVERLERDVSGGPLSGSEVRGVLVAVQCATPGLHSNSTDPES